MSFLSIDWIIPTNQTFLLMLIKGKSCLKRYFLNKSFFFLNSLFYFQVLSLKRIFRFSEGRGGGIIGIILNPPTPFNEARDLNILSPVCISWSTGLAFIIYLSKRPHYLSSTPFSAAYTGCFFTFAPTFPIITRKVLMSC